MFNAALYRQNLKIPYVPIGYINVDLNLDSSSMQCAVVADLASILP